MIADHLALYLASAGRSFHRLTSRVSTEFVSQPLIDILDHLLAGAEQTIAVTDLLDATRKTFDCIDSWFKTNSS